MVNSGWKVLDDGDRLHEMPGHDTFQRLVLDFKRISRPLRSLSQAATGESKMSDMKIARMDRLLSCT